jgi:hypothetical protein
MAAVLRSLRARRDRSRATVSPPIA